MGREADDGPSDRERAAADAQEMDAMTRPRAAAAPSLTTVPRTRY
jgi:hypothetical protein